MTIEHHANADYGKTHCKLVKSIIFVVPLKPMIRVHNAADATDFLRNIVSFEIKKTLGSETSSSLFYRKQFNSNKTSNNMSTDGTELIGTQGDTNESYLYCPQAVVVNRGAIIKATIITVFISK